MYGGEESLILVEIETEYKLSLFLCRSSPDVKKNPEIHKGKDKSLDFTQKIT